MSSNPDHWSEEQIETVRKLRSGELSAQQVRHHGTYSDRAEQSEFDREPRPHYSVSVEECQQIQTADGDGQARVKIAKKHDLSLKQVRYHADGDCMHESPTCVDERRCNVIREMATDGLLYREIADRISGVSRRAAQYHAVGNCSHERGCPPVDHRHDWKETDQ